MKDLPRAAQIYIWIVALIAGACLLAAIVRFPLTLPDTRNFLIFGTLSAVAGLFPIILPRRLIEITTNVAVDIAAVVLLPFSFAVLIPAIAALVTEVHQRRVWYKAVFNVSSITVTCAILNVLFRTVRSGNGGGSFIDGWQDIIALSLVGVGYFALDSFLIVLIVSLTSGLSFWYIWQTNYRSITWHQISMVCAGFLMAFLWTEQPWSIVLIILPVAILRQALSLTGLLETQTYEAIEALVDAIDARDASTHQHSERVATYSRAIAEAMDLPQDEIERITISARLHDLGKVGISDAWLFKAGPLTDEERAQFQRHAEIGAEIVSRFPVLGVEKAMVRSHHERWDGRGYPDGLVKEQAPLGARIIGVSDAFDAMTSDRPYRKALSFAEARSRLRAGVGTQFDATIIAAALPVLPGADEETVVEETPEVVTVGKLEQMVPVSAE